MSKIMPFLMYAGQAEEAITFYISLFADGRITHIQRYGPGEPGAEGTVKLAGFALNGQEFLAIDSNVQHAFTFTPAISLHVTCASAAEVDDLFAKLSAGGQVLMPLTRYPFSERYAWVTDRFGVAWQLNLAQ
ncbi:MAG: VOC family protein [Anaerolineales bacterium]|nr:VOC family protein [Anaerolineales bacterium]